MFKTSIRSIYFTDSDPDTSFLPTIKSPTTPPLLNNLPTNIPLPQPLPSRPLLLLPLLFLNLIIIIIPQPRLPNIHTRPTNHPRAPGTHPIDPRIRPRNLNLPVRLIDAQVVAQMLLARARARAGVNALETAVAVRPQF